jgi:biotin transport system permease protein
MAPPVAPWQYRAGGSPLHRLHPLAKLALFLAASLAGLLYPPWGLLCAAALVSLGVLFSGLKPREIFSGLRMLAPLVAPLLAVVIACKSFRWDEAAFSIEGLKEALFLAGGMSAAFAAAAVFFSVTSQGELYEAFNKIEGKFYPGHKHNAAGSLRGKRVSLALSLMLSFIPRFFYLWEEKECAFRARAGKGALARLSLLVPPLVEAMIESAEETALALESRGLLV